jgi:hypothetical protein
MSRFDYLLKITRRAKANDGVGALSTGEALAAALVLNRSDWLAGMNYTMAQALERIDDDFFALIPQVERMLRAESGL